MEKSFVDDVHFILSEEKPKIKKRFYKPEFSELAAVSVRRLAWAMGASMGQAVDAMVLLLPAYLKQEKICAACKDNSKCISCIFKCGAIPPLKLLDLVK